jgi:uncharacterized damage-inducible protein DinB
MATTIHKEWPMKLSELLLPEFDQEMATTRRVLERVPEDKLSFKPHEKSMPMDRLAGHVAEMVSWAAESVEKDFVDFAPVGGTPMQPTIATSRKQLLEIFDKNCERSRKAIAGASNEELMKSWSLKRAGETLFTMPKLSVVRTFCLNHIIHHRAQLSVYLRLNNVPVPSMYGPSADEGKL